MPEWLPVVGEAEKALAFFVGLWKRWQERKQARLGLYWDLDGDTCLLYISNAGSTATATDVQLYVDGRPFADHERVLRDAENLASIPQLPPMHTEIRRFGVRVNARIGTMSHIRPAALKRVHVTWTDGRGEHELTPAEVEALPRYRRSGPDDR